MSVSKLESLPNEILVDILEKYLDGLDILKAFAFQLNRRFDAVVMQCQRFRFDFMKCRKDDFRLCIDLLPAYVEKIEELALSEQNAPGQIHSFLSFYPSFSVFKRLRKLHFHPIGQNTVDAVILQNALCSLLNTTIDTLSLEITTTVNSSAFKIIDEIFRIKTLKKLSLVCGELLVNWTAINNISSNINYLTVHGTPFTLSRLSQIFRYAPALKYLDVDLWLLSDFYNRQANLFPKDTITMSMLDTVIFNIIGFDNMPFSELKPCFQCMPALHHLEIKTRDELSSVCDWTGVFETSLPSLIYFTLQICPYDEMGTELNKLVASSQMPFWIERENFNIIVKTLPEGNRERFWQLTHQYWLGYRPNPPVGIYWIGPQRKQNGNLHALNAVSHLYVPCSSYWLQNYYLNNVTHLTIDELNRNLLQFLQRM